jgi:hypothetical protein
VSVPYSESGRFSILTNQESAEPESIRPDLTSRLRLAAYSIETATPFSKTTFFPTLL